MTLKEIETIVRANFIFDKSGEHKEASTVPNEWRVVEKTYCNNDMMALIIFCGTCWVLGFDEQDVIKYLEIKKQKHFTLLIRFKQAIQAHQAAQTQSIFEEIMPEVNKMIVKKSQIVMNGIKAKQPASYINLADFNF